MGKIKSNAASVEFRNVTKIYGKSKVAAVNDISLAIEAGKLVTLLGPSGCGKTTTLRMIAGLELATSGRITLRPFIERHAMSDGPAVLSRMAEHALGRRAILEPRWTPLAAAPAASEPARRKVPC